MLVSLSIRNIVLIDKLDLALESGFSVLTGETGAGKSILLEALGLACGERGGRTHVRAGADKAVVTALFEPPAGHPAYAVLKEVGVDAAPGEPIILRRTLTADGPSRAHVNDQPASVGLLSRLGDALVEIHGQHDGRGLMNPQSHRGFLDNYAGISDKLDIVRTAWHDLIAVQARLDELLNVRDKAISEEAFLRASVEELVSLAPQSGEEGMLAAERQFLQQAETALIELNAAMEVVAAGDGPSNRLNTALRGLERIQSVLAGAEESKGYAGAAHTSVERAAGALDRALIEFSEAEDALGEAVTRFNIEPGQLNKVEERLFALRAAARKHNVDVDALATLTNQLTTRLDMVERVEDRVKETRAALNAAQADYVRGAKVLSCARKKAGAVLACAVEAELAPLKMDKTRFRVRVDADENNPGAYGWDEVVFEVSTNPGAPFGPLNKIASGGELSRFSLALKICLVGDNVRTMVFDEIDQGVGGVVASAVGSRLRQVAKTGQVLVVTHSPQVAAQAGAHYRIEKTEAKGTLRTAVCRLTEEERREEIACMLSGVEVTDEARAAADQLLSS